MTKKKDSKAEERQKVYCEELRSAIIAAILNPRPGEPALKLPEYEDAHGQVCTKAT